MSKIRTDYITNSSSSSFVIMYKQMPQLEKEVVEKYPFLRKYINNIEKLVFGNRMKVTNIEELKEYISDRFGYDSFEEAIEEESYLKEMYDEYKEGIENGFAITFKEVDYCDDGTAEMLRSLDDGINFIIKHEN